MVLHLKKGCFLILVLVKWLGKYIHVLYDLIILTLCQTSREYLIASVKGITLIVVHVYVYWIFFSEDDIILYTDILNINTFSIGHIGGWSNSNEEVHGHLHFIAPEAHHQIIFISYRERPFFEGSYLTEVDRVSIFWTPSTGPIYLRVFKVTGEGKYGKLVRYILITATHQRPLVF